MTRIPVSKTPKCYVGGKFIRSESGRVMPLTDARGNFVAHLPLCSRKDLRNAVEEAAKAGPGWASRSGYNRGQILYRWAEMMEARAEELAAAVAVTGGGIASARKEVTAAIDVLVHYAGWADKYEQILGSVNPVASPHFNFTVTEPVGVVGLIAPAEKPLGALIAMLAPVVASGNTAIVQVSEKNGYPAIILGEMLATSDLPGGVVNMLTSGRAELLDTFATHEQIRSLYVVAGGDAAIKLQQGAAASMKRVRRVDPDAQPDWSSVRGSVYAIRDFVEFKTTWHPVGA